MDRYGVIFFRVKVITFNVIVIEVTILRYFFICWSNLLAVMGVPGGEGTGIAAEDNNSFSSIGIVAKVTLDAKLAADMTLYVVFNCFTNLFLRDNNLSNCSLVGHELGVVIFFFVGMTQMWF